MTTTASKHGLRAAAGERRSKHAQRTALPPQGAQANPTVAAIADRVVAVAGTTKEQAYGRMTVPELKARAKALGIPWLQYGGMKKGELLNAILEAERKASRAAEYEAANAEQDQIAQDADAPSGAYVPDAPVEAPSAHVAPMGLEEKGVRKAERLQAALQPYGWSHALLDGEDNRVTATVTRGQEVLQVTWHGGVFSYEETSHTVGDRVTKVRNVSAALKLGGRTTEAAAAELARVVANRRFKRAAPRNVPAPKRLPFDIKHATDEALKQALVGKVVEWINRVSGASETARVSKDDRFFRVLGEGEDRTVQFNSDSGSRACRISQIVRVGGSARRRPQAQAAGAVAA